MMAAADGQYLVKVEEYGILVYVKSYEKPPSWDQIVPPLGDRGTSLLEVGSGIRAQGARRKS